MTRQARPADRVQPGYRILGIDPGTRELGYAVLELDRRLDPQPLTHGSCRLSPKKPLEARLREIYEALKGFLDQLAPDVVVVEDVFHGKNIQSALRIGESRGVVLLAAAMAEREVVQYAPAIVKKSICGNGRAAKSQVFSMVQRLLALEEPPRSHDAADALAIALCHAQRVKTGLSAVASAAPRGRRRGVTTRSLQALLDRINQGRA